MKGKSLLYLTGLTASIGGHSFVWQNDLTGDLHAGCKDCNMPTDWIVGKMTMNGPHIGQTSAWYQCQECHDAEKPLDPAHFIKEPVKEVRA